MAGRDAAKERIDQIHQRIGKADPAHRHRTLRKEILRDLTSSKNRVAERQRYLWQRKQNESQPHILCCWSIKMWQAKANTLQQHRSTQLEDDCVRQTNG